MPCACGSFFSSNLQEWFRSPECCVFVLLEHGARGTIEVHTLLAPIVPTWHGMGTKPFELGWDSFT